MKKLKSSENSWISGSPDIVPIFLHHTLTEERLSIIKDAVKKGWSLHRACQIVDCDLVQVRAKLGLTGIYNYSQEQDYFEKNFG